MKNLKNKNIYYLINQFIPTFFIFALAYAALNNKVDASVLTQAPRASIFNKEELDWIKSNPTQEVFSSQTTEGTNSIHNYLLHTIQKKSGIKFIIKRKNDHTDNNVLTQKIRPDVILGVNEEHLKNPTIKNNYYASKPFMRLMYVIVTKSNHPFISALDDLKNRRVATRADTLFYTYYKNKYNLIPSKSPEDILNKINNGQADAGILLEIHAQNLLRKTKNGLTITNLVNAPPIGLCIIVNKNNPILFSIINKSLLNTTAADLSFNLQQWKDDTEQTTPNIRELWIGYHWHISLAIILFISLLISLSLSLNAYRAKQKSDRSKSKFLAMMSHELRTPLGIIIASMELLKRTTLNSKQHQLTSHTNQAAHSLLTLLNDVLDTAQIEAGKLTIELRSVNLQLLLIKLLEQYQPSIQEKGLKLLLDTHQLPEYLELDEARIQQILYNLLSNALKFTTQGSIQLSAYYLANSKQIYLEVTDTGIGIPVNKQQHLFTPFTQANTSTSRQYGGSGLGLSICKELITLMNGTIQLKSTPNIGTKIYIKLPTRPCEQPDIQAPPILIDKQASTQHKILLVEDHPSNQQVIEEQLRSLGYHCQVAKDGYQALVILKEGQQFALVLLDCHLPGMDGYEVAVQIRQQLALKSLPIIAISAATDDEHRKRCIDSGIDGVLNKPLKLAQLKSTLEIWLDDDTPRLPIVSDDMIKDQYPWLSFIKNNEKDFAQAEIAIKQQDYSNAILHIHRISGAAHTMQIYDIASISTELEKTLRQHPEMAAQNMYQLRIALDNFIPN